MVQDPALHKEQLGHKKAGFDSNRATTFAAEERSLPGQRECLELFLDYLPKRHPELYTVTGDGDNRTISVSSTGEMHRVGDYAARPLELCNRIVQEDLVLMRAIDQPTTEPFGGAKHVMTAAAVVFSFGDLQEKLSSPLTFIHAPVPNFEEDLNKLLNKTFDSLRPEHAVWRNNWLLVESGDIATPSFGTPEALAARKQLMPARSRFLKVELQTLRRLKKSNDILFTVRTFLQPISRLEGDPAAAATLAASLRGLRPASAFPRTAAGTVA